MFFVPTILCASFFPCFRWSWTSWWFSLSGERVWTFCGYYEFGYFFAEAPVLRDLKRGSETKEINITHIHFLLRPRLFIDVFSVTVMNARDAIVWTFCGYLFFGRRPFVDIMSTLCLILLLFVFG